nr:hypothetical protein Itr_chr13CG17230 [Ipomoea trifida]
MKAVAPVLATTDSFPQSVAPSSWTTKSRRHLASGCRRHHLIVHKMHQDWITTACNSHQRSSSHRSYYRWIVSATQSTSGTPASRSGSATESFYDQSSPNQIPYHLPPYSSPLNETRKLAHQLREQ